MEIMDTKAKIKGPIGRCQYCGQEFMRQGSLVRHEKEVCPKRPKEEKAEEPVAKPVENKQGRFYKPRIVIGGGAIVWTKQ